MRHRIIAAILVLALVVLAALSSYMPLAFLADLILLGVGAAIGFGILVFLIFVVKGLLFDRAIDRYHRFN